jgi:Protein of unknown function (DUF3467)
MSDTTDKNDEKETPQPKPKAYTTPPQGMLDIYSNHILVNWGIYDLRIRFGQLIPISGESEGDGPTQRVVEERAAVTLAWTEVLMLRNLLSDVLARYEKVNGELKLPKLP